MYNVDCLVFEYGQFLGIMSTVPIVMFPTQPSVAAGVEEKQTKTLISDEYSCVIFVSPLIVTLYIQID